MRNSEHDEEPKVVEVVPILRGLPKPTLSYFYRGPIEEGEFVSIEVRSTPTLGIVSKVSHARTLKSDLKSAGFALRKLGKSLPGLGLSSSFVRAAERAAEYYVTTPGKMLASLVPKMFLG